MDLPKSVIDEPQYGFKPAPRHHYDMPDAVRRTSALKASAVGLVSCLVGILIAAPFGFSDEASILDRAIVAGWCLLTACMAAWGYIWHKYFESITYEVWSGGPVVRLAPGAHEYYIDPEWLRDAILTFARMWNANTHVRVDAGRILGDMTLVIVPEPPEVYVPPELVSDSEEVNTHGRAIAMTDSGAIVITVWGPRSQDLHGTLEYEFGHPLMLRDGFASDMAPGKEREQAWLRERKRLGLLDTKEFRKK